MKKSIKISNEYPEYWEYNGNTLLLLGGSKEDNLFQIPDIEEHLRLLHLAGGNYVRCTMSSRDKGDVWPFKKEQNGLYNLNKPSEEYWNRFSKFLQLCYELDIIVQIELWDRFDFWKEPWDNNPFNPCKNNNYTKENSSLKETYKIHPYYNKNRFFYTVPEEDNNTVVLPYQKIFVDWLLSYSFKYPNILYCIDNETSGSWKWSNYWANYIKNKAKEEGASINITEMWDAHDLTDKSHKATFDHPELYNYADISQNNHQKGQVHWHNAQQARKIISNKIRPLNNVKIYGSDEILSIRKDDDNCSYGSTKDGMERFWRIVLGKMASARFHRPPYGIGLSKEAIVNIKSMRMLEDKISLFNCEVQNNLIKYVEDNETYCLANMGKEIILFFPQKGNVTVDISHIKGNMTISWLNILENKWINSKHIKETNIIKLKTPIKKMQIALIKKD